MKKLKLTLLIIAVILLAYAQVKADISVTCSSTYSSGVTSSTCSSSDASVPSGGVSNTNSSSPSAQSYIVVNNTANSAMSVSSSSNTKPINLNLFMTSGGSPANVSFDLSSKYDDSVSTNGLTQSPNSSSAFFVGELVNNLTVNVGGYAGKNGLNASQICANKILAGDYGATVKTQFQNRCTDGTTANPCSAAKMRSSCDSQDLINIDSYASSDLTSSICPSGYSYMSGYDSVSNPDVPINVTTPKSMRKCSSGSWYEPLKQCQRIGTRYRFTMTNDPGGDWNYNAIWAGHGAIPSAWTDTYIEESGNFITKASAGFLNDRACDNTTCVMSIEIPNSAGVNFAGGAYRYDWIMRGSNTSCSLGGVSCSLGAVNTSTASVGSVNYIVYRTTSCSAGEIDLGNTTGHGNLSYYHPEVVWWRDSSNSCSSLPIATGTFGSQQPPYSDLGVFTGHGLTSTSDSLNYDHINPILTFLDNTCNTTSCPNGTTSLTTNTGSLNSLTTGDAQSGSLGGYFTAFVYKVSGSENYTYSNGSNGSNGTLDLTIPVNQKKCYLKHDNVNTPNVAFYYNNFSVFNFSLSQKTFTNNFPARLQGEVIQVYKRVDPSVLDLIKGDTCPSCP